MANTSASSLLEKLRPYTCLLSLHWWKVGVAWLYFSPLRMAQLITTCKEQGVWTKELLFLNPFFYLMILPLSAHDSECAVDEVMINVDLQ